MRLIIQTSKAKRDKNGIWISNLELSNEVKVSQQAWEDIYNFNNSIFTKDREEFTKSKLHDHLSYINQSYNFTKDTHYLEIGCGPAYIGEYLMQKYNLHFIGVDFNYPFLVVLNKYFKKKGYKNFTLIYGDINDMPIKKNSIDFVYGGGVIEHSKQTAKILNHLYELLKPSGVSFNTVPALNAWWLTRFYYSIPALQPFRSIAEYIHMNVLNNKILLKNYGYELSFTRAQLHKLHQDCGYTEINTGAFAFHPSIHKSSYTKLAQLYFRMSQNPLLSPLFYVYGKKS